MAARLAPEQAARWTRQGLKPMNAAAAIAELASAMESGRSRVAVMDLDWASFLDRSPARSDASLFSELPPRAEQRRAAHASGADATGEIRAVPFAERRSTLAHEIKRCARLVLGLEQTSFIGGDVPLQDLGLDSLMALEMRTALSQSLGLSLSATLLFNFPTVDALGTHLLGLLFPPAPVEDAPVTADHDDLDQLTTLTDAEAERLLAQELEDIGKEKLHA
jgi:acyl carrier protein